MLTLKFIDHDAGTESISQCHSLRADCCDDGRRRVAAYQSEMLQEGPVAYYIGKGPVKRDGRRLPTYAVLYVMNRDGATVATYHFEKPNVPETSE